MKPVYANSFGLSKTQNPAGKVIEVTLDINHKYMDSTTTVTSKGVENIATPAIDTIIRVVMTRTNAIALRNLLDQTLGDLED